MKQKPIYFISLLLFTTILLFFFRAVTSGHLSIDDWGYTCGCPFVKDGLSLVNIKTAFSNFSHGGIWMPLTYITYMSDISISGGGWKMLHFTNILLHSITAVGVFIFILLLLKNINNSLTPFAIFASLIGSFLWAIHPMRAEAVVWIASRKEILWSFFTILASIFWLFSITNPKRLSTILAFVFFILASLSKPTAVIFPVLAFILEKTLNKDSKPNKLKYAALLFISLITGVIALHSQSNPSGIESINISDTTFTWRILNAAVSLGLYIFNTIFPISIHMDYRAAFNEIPLSTPLGLTLLGITIAPLIWISIFKKNTLLSKVVFLATSWYFISILPVLGLLGVTGDKAFADRYSYLPSVIISFAIALILVNTSNKKLKIIFASFSCCAVAALSLLSIPVIDSFKNDFTAYSRVQKFDPDHWRALRMIGRELAGRHNKQNEGIQMLEKSMRLRPSYITASHLAYLLAHRGNNEDFAKVKRLGASTIKDTRIDKSGMMLDALGVTALREKEDAKAVTFFTASLLAPMRSYTNVHTMYNLALALANEGKRLKAIKTLTHLSTSCDDNMKKRIFKTLESFKDRSKTRFDWSAE